MNLRLFRLDTLAAMKEDAVEMAFESDATPEVRHDAHEVIVAIDRQLDKNMAWALQVRALLDVGVAG